MEPDKQEPDVDERCLEYMAASGVEATPEFVALYKRAKFLKDRIHPGHMSPEGFALCAAFSEALAAKRGPGRPPKSKEDDKEG